MAEINPQNSTMVVGYFSSEQSAESALRSLHAAGFTRGQIGVACHEEPAITVKKREPGFMHRTRSLFGGGDNPMATRTGAAQPLSTGQVSGPVTTGHTNLDAGDFRHTLTGLSLPDGREGYFQERFDREKEGIVVMVDAPARIGEAEAILKTNGADLGENRTPRLSAEPMDAAEAERRRKIA